MGASEESIPEGAADVVPEVDTAAVLERMRWRMLRLFGRQPWVEDVCQSAMETFLRKRHTWRGEGTIEAFADTIALNKARDWMRRQRRTVLLREIVADYEEWPDLAAGPGERTESRDRLRRLGAILERLSVKCRMPYLLYHVENRTVAEIAEIENVSERAIRKRLERARAEIRHRALEDPVLAEWLESLEETP